MKIGDQCREVFCESGIQQWRAIPGEHLCYVEQAGAITCLEVIRFTRPYFCLQPESFGYNNDVFPPAIRVQHGCSAEFRVCFSPPVFSDSLYQAPAFQYVDHSNDYVLTTTLSSTPKSTKSSTNSSSTLSVLSPSTTPTVIPQTIHRNQTHNSTDILHRSSVVTNNITPYIAASVPSVCVIALVVMVICLLWRRSKREASRDQDIHGKENITKPQNTASLSHTGDGQTEPYKSHSLFNIEAILNKQIGQIISENNDRTNEPSTSNDMPTENKPSTLSDEPSKRRSEHLYYTLESAAKYRKQRESLQRESTKRETPLQSAKSKACRNIHEVETRHDVNRTAICGHVCDLSEEMYDNLRNRWSEYSEDRYDHMNAYVTLCRNGNKGNIVGQEYAHLNTSTS